MFLVTEKVVREHQELKEGGELSLASAIEEKLVEMARNGEECQKLSIEFSQETWHGFCRQMHDAGALEPSVKARAKTVPVR